MARVTGVQFQKNGKMYFFDPMEFEPHQGDYVIVDTVRGVDLGEIVMEPRDVPMEEGKDTLKAMLRFATEEDVQHAMENRAREKEAYSICQRKIAEHQLEMKLVSVEYAFDNSKILFYFTANGRVDFRSLVKDLASVFKTRIELRQIGVRDEARMLGGLGPCGRPICCGTFLTDFEPVSIRMAKEQNLSLNPTKISGVCGRLMCCLKYEQDHYEQTRKRMPRIGREVITPDGTGTVNELNIVKETVSVRIMNGDSSEIKWYDLDKISRPGDVKANADPRAEAEKTEAEVSGEEQVSDPDIRIQEDQQETQAVRAPSRSGERPATPDQPSREEDGHYAAGRKGKPETARKKGEPKLGHPVRRENPKKQRTETKPTAPASAAPSKKNVWADQLQQAIQAIEPE